MGFRFTSRHHVDAIAKGKGKRAASSWERCVACGRVAHLSLEEQDACIAGVARMAEIRLACGLEIHELGVEAIKHTESVLQLHSCEPTD